jgi:endoglucanase
MSVTRWKHGTDLAAEVAAAMAAASEVLPSAEKASRCWIKAKELYDFADKHRGKYSDVIKEAQGRDQIFFGQTFLA